MWYACLGVLFVILFASGWYKGPNFAVGCTSVAALLVPTWVNVTVWDYPIDLRLASGMAALGLYCVHRKSAFYVRLVFVDIVGLTLVAIHLASDLSHDGLTWRVPLRVYGEWLVPYLLGRVAIQNWDDVRELTPIIVGVGCVLAACAIAESLIQANIFEFIFGEGNVEGLSRNSMRWGWKRSFGPVRNPIYFGTLQLLLFPWMMYAASLAVRRDGPRWWLCLPAVMVGGILATLSRAPVLAIIPLAFMASIAFWPQWRRTLIGAAIFTLLLLAVNYDRVIESLNKLGGAPAASRRETIDVNGERVEYTTALHRLYLLDVYGGAMKHAGLLGYGTDRTTGFPPRVPIGPTHLKTLKRMWCVDNAYILLVLRFGWLGSLSFSLMGLAAVGTYARLAQGQGLRGRMFAANMAGGILATMFVLLTVWMPSDFGWWLMWSIGAAGGMAAPTSKHAIHIVVGRGKEGEAPSHLKNTTPMLAITESESANIRSRTNS